MGSGVAVGVGVRVRVRVGVRVRLTLTLTLTRRLTAYMRSVRSTNSRMPSPVTSKVRVCGKP